MVMQILLSLVQHKFNNLNHGQHHTMINQNIRVHKYYYVFADELLVTCFFS